MHSNAVLPLLLPPPPLLPLLSLLPLFPLPSSLFPLPSSLFTPPSLLFTEHLPNVPGPGLAQYGKGLDGHVAALPAQRKENAFGRRNL